LKGTPDDAKAKATATYDAAADSFDLASNSFWARFGRSTIERIGLRAGARVLDVFCGTGASAIPAAETVGARGSVLGVDLAPNMCEAARAKARSFGLRNVEFRVADALALGEPDGAFDAVVCVFGIFFVPDMHAAARELWRMVARGGALAVTTWGPDVFEPMNSVFWGAVRELRPDLERAFHPWDRIQDPDSLTAMLVESGVDAPRVVAEPARHPLASAHEWWSLVMGSGYRGTVDRLAPEHRLRVRRACDRGFERLGVRDVETNVVYAVARKGGVTPPPRTRSAAAAGPARPSPRARAAPSPPRARDRRSRA